MIAAIPELQDTLACWRAPSNAPIKDTFAQILENEAARADPRQLAPLNGLQNPDLFKVGQVLILPRETSTSPADSCPQAVDQKRMAGGETTPKRALAPAKVTKTTGKGQIITASWYGPRHHGKLMANGQPFDMHADTAAHRTLPFGTHLRLTNPANGRSVQVRITDRGPFIPGRSLDLSYSAAQKLGVVKAGVSRLYLEQS